MFDQSNGPILSKKCFRHYFFIYWGGALYLSLQQQINQLCGGPALRDLLLFFSLFDVQNNIQLQEKNHNHLLSILSSKKWSPVTHVITFNSLFLIQILLLSISKLAAPTTIKWIIIIVVPFPTKLQQFESSDWQPPCILNYGRSNKHSDKFLILLMQNKHHSQYRCRIFQTALLWVEKVYLIKWPPTHLDVSLDFSSCELQLFRKLLFPRGHRSTFLNSKIFQEFDGILLHRLKQPRGW